MPGPGSAVAERPSTLDHLQRGRHLHAEGAMSLDRGEVPHSAIPRGKIVSVTSGRWPSAGEAHHENDFCLLGRFFNAGGLSHLCPRCNREDDTSPCFAGLFSLRGPVQIVVPMHLPFNTPCKKHVISHHSTVMPRSRQVKRRNGFHSN